MVRQSSSGTLRRVVVGYCLAVTEWRSKVGCVSESSGLAVPVRRVFVLCVQASRVKSW